MQFFVILIILALMAYDPGQFPDGPLLDGLWMSIAFVAPYLLVALLTAWVCRHGVRRLQRRPEGAIRTLRWTDWVMNSGPWLVVVILYVQIYFLGLLAWLRTIAFDSTVLADLIALAGPLAAVIFSFWLYYPIDRHLRESSLIRQIESGQSVWPIGTRGQYVLSQIRHQLLLMLVPLMAMLIWTRLVEAWIGPDDPWAQYQPALVFAGGLTVFLLAPLMLRYVWDTTPLPDGSLRQRLVALCDQYRVRVRELLLWKTYGGAINGAVMGLIGPLRYILLTDGLIDRMSPQHVEAVMAHELGHVARRHMPWLAICAFATLTVLYEGVFRGLDAVERWTQFEATSIHWLPPRTIEAAAGLIVVIGWLAVFGFMFRRFERQADTFAVQHMSQQLGESSSDENASPADAARADATSRISEAGVGAMTGALLRVAELNHHPTRRASWRHGSIDWRVRYLRSLIGRPIDGCSIDRQMVAIRWTCAALLAGMAVVSGL